MKLLFEMDKKDYAEGGRAFVRPSARAILIRDGKVAMVHSLQYDYYKFPGGGIEQGESPVQAVIRETAEEAGLMVVPERIQEYGYVHRVQRSDRDDASRFIQDNFYYLCEAEEKMCAQKLCDYEAEERFTLEWVEPAHAIDINRNRKHGDKDQTMLEREARVLEMLMAEGRF